MTTLEITVLIFRVAIKGKGRERPIAARDSILAPVRWCHFRRMGVFFSQVIIHLYIEERLVVTEYFLHPSGFYSGLNIKALIMTSIKAFPQRQTGEQIDPK